MIGRFRVRMVSSSDHRDWPLPGLVKCLLVTVATMAVLLASYEWCVRYTFIGAVLNGRKYRTRANGVVLPAA